MFDKLLGSLNVFERMREELCLPAPIPNTTLKESDSVYALVLGSDGRLYSGGWDETIKVWDVSKGKCVQTLKGHSGTVTALALGSDGRLYSGCESNDKTIKVWDVSKGECVQTLKGHSGAVRALALDSDGRLYSGSNDKTIKVWDVSKGECVQTFLEKQSNAIRALVLGSDGRLYSGGDDSIKIWDVSKGECVQVLRGHYYHVHALALDSDGRLYSGSMDEKIKVWDVAKGKCIATLKGQSNHIESLAFGPNGYLYSGGGSIFGGGSYAVKVWDVNKPPKEALVCALKGHKNNVEALVVGPEGRVYSASRDKTIKVWSDFVTIQSVLLGLLTVLEKMDVQLEEVTLSLDLISQDLVTVQQFSTELKAVISSLDHEIQRQKLEAQDSKKPSDRVIQILDAFSAEVAKLRELLMRMAQTSIPVNLQPVEETQDAQLSDPAQPFDVPTCALNAIGQPLPLLPLLPAPTSKPIGHCKEAQSKGFAIIAQGDDSAFKAKLPTLNVNATDAHKQTLLHCAARYGRINMVNDLIDSGARLNELDEEGNTPLLRALKSKQQAVVKLLGGIRGVLLDVKDSQGNTSLLLAIKGSHAELANYLIKSGARLNGTDSEGNGLLHVAIKAKQLGVARHLIDKGIKLEGTDGEGNTPLLMTVRGKYRKIAMHLVDKGAKLDVTDKEGNTPLHLAVKGKQADVARYLVQHGANGDLKNKKGKTAHQMAADSVMMQGVFDNTSTLKPFTQHDEQAKLKQEKEKASSKPTSSSYKSLPMPKKTSSIGKRLPAAPKLKPVARCKALYDYTAEVGTDELSVKAGTLLTVLKKHDSGWWLCQGKDNQGLVPSTYLEEVQQTRQHKASIDESGHMRINLLIPYQELSFAKKLGQGSFGTVHAGTLQDHTQVAIKKLLLDRLTERTEEEFKSEAAIMGQLRHPNVVALYGIVLQPEYCMVMELLENGSLYSVLHSKRELDWDLRQRIALDMSRGLAFLHSKKILHRDLKSLNVLLDGNMRAKLADFGLSLVRAETKSKTKQNESTGTLQWMAPELLSGEKMRYDASCDIYSLAVTLWELAARKLPFEEAPNPSLIPLWIAQGEREAIPTDCPESLAKLIIQSWSGTSTERPSASAIVQRLQAAISSQSHWPERTPSDNPASSYRGTGLANITGSSYRPNTGSGGTSTPSGYRGNVSTLPSQGSYRPNVSEAASGGYLMNSGESYQYK